MGEDEEGVLVEGRGGEDEEGVSVEGQGGEDEEGVSVEGQGDEGSLSETPTSRQTQWKPVLERRKIREKKGRKEDGPSGRAVQRWRRRQEERIENKEFQLLY